MNNWNNAQKNAINATGNILVSAGAGSGKTAVLTERIVKLIKGGCSIMDFAICTFTEAATLEMKGRIRERLLELGLYDQADKVYMADILSIHGLCNIILKENFNVVGLPPKQITLTEPEVLKNKAMDSAINELYEDEEFLSFATKISPRDDKALRRMLFSLYEFAGSIPDFDRFVDNQISGDTDQIKKEFCRIKSYLLGEILGEYDELLKSQILEEPEVAAMEKDAEDLEHVKESLMAGEFAVYTFKTAPRNAPNKDIFNAVRDKAKKAIKSIDAFWELIDCNEIMEQTTKDLIQLKKGFDGFTKEFTRLKLEDGYITYNDMEMYAYKILKNDQVSEFYKSRYKHIFVDEYQDTSKLQQAILERLSTGHNMFMVGDIKQSIYAFRNADPSMFHRIYNEYDYEGEKIKIDLPINYRSTENILNCVNDIFSILLNITQEYYPKDAYLRTECNHDMMPVDIDLVEETSGGVDQAMHIVQRIEELVSEGFAYRDMAVLFQSVKSAVAQNLYNLLRQKGIPAVISTSADKIFIETSIFMSLLSLIDNPTIDIDLVSVLFSEIGKLNTSDLIKIRSGKNGSFYECAKNYKGEKGLEEKLSCFFNMLDEFRQKSRNMATHELMSMVLMHTGYFRIIESHENSRAKTSQIYMMQKKAREYESMGNYGLSGFLHYYEKAQELKNQEDEGGYTEGSDAVSILTIHKSKGLAFPVVILGDTNKRIFSIDGSGILNLDKDLGIGITHIDPKRRKSISTPLQTLIKDKKQIDTLSEKMRLLYVAMTRPKNKLIIVGSINEEDRKDLEENCTVSLTKLLSSKTTFLQCILMAVYSSSRVGIISINNIKCKSKVDASKPVVVPEYNKEIEKILDKEMDTSITVVPKKASVTGLTKEEKVFVPHKARGKKSDNTGALMGTITHAILSLVKPGESAGQVIGRMNKDEYFTEYELGLVDKDMIQGFLDSSLYARMRGSKKLFLEKPFILELGEDSKYTKEPVMVQGIIDCMFLENDQYVLVDYKTDNIVKDADVILKKRYTKQLELYAFAIERLTGKKVKERIIYHLRTKKIIEIN